MLGMIELATHDDASSFVVIREFVVQMGVGTVLGALGGVVLIWTLRRIALASEGLYPVLALVLAGALYALTSLADGSGFLAVFIAGLLLGDARTPYKGEIERFSSSLATFAELGVFVALGLTIELGGISARTWVEGVMLAVLVALVVRPPVVLLTLVGARLSRPERAFIAWSGLKGAVPILLAAFALLAGVDEADRVYSLVFVVVLVSVVGQGTLLPYMARVFRIPIRETASLPWEFSVRLEEEPEDVHEFEIGPASRARGRPIRELPLGTRSWVTLVVRNGAATRPTGALVLEAGDRVLVLSDPNDVEPLRKLFRSD
jgi:cell volume regulation protein A